MIVIYERGDFRLNYNDKNEPVYSLRKERLPWEDYDFMLKAKNLETGNVLFRFESPVPDPYCDSFDHLDEVLDYLVRNFDIYHDFNGYIYFETNVDKGTTYDVDAFVWEVENGVKKRDVTEDYEAFFWLDFDPTFFPEYMKELEEEREFE